VEVNQQTEDTQTLSRQHAGGEIFEAENIEAAHRACSFLGGLSLEEARSLIELETMGKEQLANESDLSKKAAAEKPVIERIETTEKPVKKPAMEDNHNRIVAEATYTSIDIQAVKATEVEAQPDTAEEPTDHHDPNENIIRQALADDMHHSFLAQQEASKISNIASDVDRLEPVKRNVYKEVQLAEVAKEVKPAYRSARTEESTPSIEEQVEQAAVLSKTSETMPKSIDPEPITKAIIPPAFEVVINKPPTKEIITVEPAVEISLENLVENFETTEPIIDEGPLFEDLDHIYNLYIQPEIPVEEAELLPPAEVIEKIEPETEESFIAVLPEAVQVQLEEYQATAPPEEAIILKSLTVFIEGAVAEMEELQEAEIIDIEKIAEVETSVAEVYDELLQKIGIEDPVEREELVKQFIAEIRAKTLVRSAVEDIADPIEEDEGTHEHKRNLSVSLWSRNLSELSHQLIGRFTVRQAQAAAGKT